MVLDADLDKALIAAKNRVYYLERRKKTGKPPSSGKYVSRKKKSAKEKFKEVPVAPQDFFWYQREVKDTNFLVKYSNLRNEFRKAASVFAEYMLKLDEVLREYGTEEEWKKFQETLSQNAPLSAEEEKELNKILK